MNKPSKIDKSVFKYGIDTAIRDNNHLVHVRLLPSLVSNSTQEVVAHHIRVGWGGQNKPHDSWTVPLTATEHSLLHDYSTASRGGERQYWYDHVTPGHWLFMEGIKAWAEREHFRSLTGMSLIEGIRALKRGETIEAK